MQINADHVLVDTSAAVALVQRAHPFHKTVRTRLQGSRCGLAGHAAVEFLSVLTRMPPPYRVTPAAALRMQQRNFPEPRFLSAEAMEALLPELVSFGLSGGAYDDGLVGAAAREYDLPLFTCDRRAGATYRALGVRFELLT